MLPAHLTGSYQRYKANTDIFTTWLTHTAAACGYRIPAARKQTAQPASAEVGGPNRFTYPIGEILRQAQAIAGSGYAGMQLPSSIQRSAERAIEGRIALSDVIKTVRQDEAGDESHAVFTGTLKGALEILKQAYALFVRTPYLSDLLTNMRLGDRTHRPRNPAQKAHRSTPLSTYSNISSLRT